MSEHTTPQEGNLADSTQSDYKVNDVVALTQLVGTIVDYYSFKNRLIEDEDSDKWKRAADDDAPIIPKAVNSMIEKSFLHQLKNFAE
jgi:hypothetical protein